MKLTFFSQKYSVKNRLIFAVLSFLSILLLLLAAASLRWRMVHDAPAILYFTFLIEKYHYVPYRDFFDCNMPGVYLVNWLTVKIFGYGDLGFRYADLLCLSAILTATFFWMKKFGWQVAWCGTVLFGLLYLGYGPYMSFQRDYLIILPIMMALLVTSSDKLNALRKGFLVGLLFGLAATIKPHVIIAFPLIIGFQWYSQETAESGPAAKSPSKYPILLGAFFGLAIPVTAVFIYLWSSGAWPSFMDTARNYWPLYSALTMEHKTIFGWARIIYLIKNYFLFGGEILWLAPAIVGVMISWTEADINAQQRRQVLLLGGLALCFSMYVLLAGKFWEYHWILFYFFIIQISTLCLVEPVKEKSQAKRIFPLLVLTGVFLVMIYPTIPPLHYIYERISSNARMVIPPGGRADKIAFFLKNNLQPGDKVQALDWTGGALHAMLIARAEPATPFLYDSIFYHHISRKYIQKLRQRFIESLKTSRPRFIIQVETEKPWVSGEDTTRKFEALQDFLDANYTVVFTGEGYFIYERRESPQSRSGLEK